MSSSLEIADKEKVKNDNNNNKIDPSSENKVNDDIKQQQSRVGEVMDLMGQDLVMKITSDGNDESKDTTTSPLNSESVVEVGDAVLIDFEGRSDNNDSNDNEQQEEVVFHKVHDWWVIVGESDVCPALEMGIRFMRRNETALITSHSKYAYGMVGCCYRGSDAGSTPNKKTLLQARPRLPPNTNVIYTVTVKCIVSSTSDDDYFVSPEFVMERAKHKKQIGNDCYQNEWPDPGKGKALRLYNSASDLMLSILEKKGNDDDAQAAAARTIMVDALNNISAVHMRAKSYGLAKEAAALVLTHDRNNAKALYRAARAAMLDPASTYEESEAALRAAEEVSPEDEEVKKLRSELDRHRKQFKQQQKQLYSRMGKGMQLTPTNTSTANSSSSSSDSDSKAEAPRNKSLDDSTSSAKATAAIEQEEENFSSQHATASIQSMILSFLRQYWKAFATNALIWVLFFIMYWTSKLKVANRRQNVTTSTPEVEEL